ncbi:YSC84-related protein [Mariprofundus ferrooxydans]|uniref:BPSL1445 family SYLF domain-containing lipoprotein n=1 Tax=Mariprofundus ferrooxydans TaxID=314344 RepID=UPI000368BC34|nr:YSC84-related protein [Mariprofundus ferrooxydans]
MNRLKQTSFMVMALMFLAPLPAMAASAVEINAKVTAALADFYKTVSGGKELAAKARGILVFPEVYKAGIGIGGEYGEGALRIGGKTVQYYSTAAASIGFQLGAQVKSQVILFMTKDALKKFRASDGWKAGVDGSVALASLGADGSIDSETAKKPIIGFIFSNKGLMYNLTFEGTKISKIKK